MNIHEYQSKQILRQYGLHVPEGYPAFTVEDAVQSAKRLDTPVVVVKAQIHAGGRGEAGGVKIAHSLDEVRQYAREILGKTLVTKQTGPKGKKGHPSSDRSGLPYQEGILPVLPCRPSGRMHRHDGF